MSIMLTPLDRAPAEYSMDSENRFRLDVQRYLMLLSTRISGASSIDGTEASLASKRENFVTPPLA